jgi:hypothetical protein
MPLRRHQHITTADGNNAMPPPMTRMVTTMDYRMGLACAPRVRPSVRRGWVGAIEGFSFLFPPRYYFSIKKIGSIQWQYEGVLLELYLP